VPNDFHDPDAKHVKFQQLHMNAAQVEKIRYPVSKAIYKGSSQYGSDFSTSSSEGEATVKKPTRRIETYLRIPGTADDRTGQKTDADSEHTGSDSEHTDSDKKNETLHRDKQAPTTAMVTAEQQK
jgi:hypothetical protein